jgi:hypothetical protein
MINLTIPANANYDSGWISKDQFNNVLTSTSVQIGWASLAGTLNGTITVEVTNGDLQTTSTVIHTITLNSANSSTDANFLQINYAIRSYKIKYTKTGITGGTIYINAAGV